MANELQIMRIVCAGAVSFAAAYYAKDVADNYFELKALSTMPESYWITKQKEADMEIKKAEIHEAAETKRKQEEIKYKKERDEKNRAHELEVMEKEKAYPDSYWIYKTEKVKTETLAKTVVKKEEASVEKQKNIANVLSAGLEVITRRLL